MITENSLTRRRNLRLAVFAALLLIAQAFNAQIANIDINNDGIRTLRAADAFIAGDVSQGFAIEEWPFYSMFLAVLHRISGVNTVAIAHGFSLVCFGLIGFCFLRIVARYDSRLIVQLLAIAVVGSLPAFNGWRDAIFREHGFWMFLLVGFWWYLQYIDSQRLRYVFFWTLATAGASLFRIEAMALFFVPLVLYLPFERGCYLKKLLVAYSLPGCAMLIGVLALVVNPHLAEQFKLKIYMIDYLGSFPQRYAEFIRVANSISWEVVPWNTRNYLPELLASGLVVVAILTMIKSLSVVHFLAALPWLGSKSFRLLKREDFKLWCCYLLVIFAYLILFTFMRRFLASRYTAGLSLMAALMLPLAWAYLWENGIRKLRINATISRIVISCIFLFATVHVFTMPHRYAKEYVYYAAQWLKANTTGPLYTNSKHIAYFGRDDYDWNLRYSHEQLENLDKLDLSRVEWIALQVDGEYEMQLGREKIAEQNIPVEIVKEFIDDRYDEMRVTIYHRIQAQQAAPGSGSPEPEQ